MILTLEKAAGASGGVQVKTLMEDANARPVLDFHAYGGQATTTKTTSGRSLVEFYITEHDGANGLANITTNGNIFGVRARVGGSDVARWIIDEDGDHFVVTVVDVTATGNAIAASAFDEHDDAQLVRAYELARNPNKAGLVRSKWDEFVSYNEQTLIDLGILGAPVTEGGMTNQSQLIRLHNGAIWQAYQTAREQGGRLSVLEEANQIKDAKIAELESKLALLEGAR